MPCLGASGGLVKPGRVLTKWNPAAFDAKKLSASELELSHSAGRVLSGVEAFWMRVGMKASVRLSLGYCLLP